MGMTITEKILAAHSGRDSVLPGEIVNAKIDLIVAHDVTTPPAVQMLKKLGINKVFDPTKIVVTPDHFVPNKDIKSAELAKQLREWREEQGITRYYEIGNHGIEAVLFELLNGRQTVTGRRYPMPLLLQNRSDQLHNGCFVVDHKYSPLFNMMDRSFLWGQSSALCILDR